MDGNERQDGGSTTATARDDGTAAVTSARAQFEAAARPRCAVRRPARAAKAVFDRLDWSGAVGATVQAATRSTWTAGATAPARC